MEVKIKRGDEFVEATSLKVRIGDSIYTISQTIDDRLSINKISESGSDDYVNIHPYSGNEFHVS